ncbi:MAG: hypothetical protein KC777_18255 [Cyanobacteria bacterium HKST-UBA02]|nr:hypothetical protein [Cyanobacteria bacterium HKST-UBA02]
MLDVRKPIAFLFLLLGALLFGYGQIFQDFVAWKIPNGEVPLKLNVPCGLFMFLFGVIMWQLARYSEIKELEKAIKDREEELSRAGKLGSEEADQEEEEEEKKDEEQSEEAKDEDPEKGSGS